jgi:ATP-dependent protease HslVU (ClpYQ) peptidase subunit
MLPFTGEVIEIDDGIVSVGVGERVAVGVGERVRGAVKAMLER